MKKIKIEGRKIYLRTLSERNATKEYCSWLNDPEVNKYLETREATIAELKNYIREKNKNPNCLFLGIFFKKNNKHIGNIKLEPIDFKNRKATLGILIGDKNYWGKGIGKEATKLLINYAFQKLNLKEINLGVISANKRAISLYKKLGFKIYQVDKKSIQREGKFFDKILMSIKNEQNFPKKS
jgi:RimJ/RimL family protein N-acetyltransferase